METLRRLIPGRHRKEQESQGQPPAAHPMAEPKLTVEVRPQVEAETMPAAGAGPTEEDVPRSPITGRPLSPRAQKVRAQLADELKEGPTIF